ncbi:hypothetical protein [Novilysobacter avium]|uniref:Uncharacterized protein n=1 Tax=Novilysobacter avium TaxID=2781023 RepID=A0A7S6UJ94_9GAMM|nr:hypothetical protein [Lysobacter avium]QOW21341.1 hypothetical protein INQ42_08670 [Lysobacter avium]
MSTVDNAINSIKDRLSQGIFDWDVSHGDLKSINNTMADLSPSERNDVIAGMSDAELENWAGEIHGSLGSLSADERQTLFNKLAEGLDAEQMVRMVAAFDASGNPDSIRELGAAVATHGSPEAKQAFIEAMAGRTNTGDAHFDPEPTHRNDVTDKLLADPDALAVAEVLASLEGEYFDDAWNALSDSQQASVMQAGIGQAETSSRNGNITNFDTTLAGRIVDAAASSSDPNVKADVFELASEKLAVVQGGGDNGAVPFGVGTDSRNEGARDTLANSMTTLINTDVNAIVARLEVVDHDGSALVTYVTEQLAAGREEQVGELITKVQKGDDLQGDPATRFIETDADGQYANAHNLGYLMGAVEAGVRTVTDDRVAQAEMIRDIFGGALKIAGLPGGGPAASGSRTGVDMLSDQIIDSIVEGYEEDGAKLSDVMYELGYPTDANGDPVNHPGAEAVFKSQRGHVLDEN